MFIPRSIGQLTGWKAVAVAAILVSIFGYQAWKSMPHYETVDSGTWNIPAEETMIYSFSMSMSGKIGFEITHSTPGELQIILINADELSKYMELYDSGLVTEGSEGGLDQMKKLYIGSGSGALADTDIRLKAGDYHLLVINTESTELETDYKIYEFRDAS